MTSLVKPYLYWLLLCGSALLTPLAFAPYGQFWLMPLLLAILIILLCSRPQYQVRSAYIWALIAYTVQFYWIDIALHDVAGMAQVYALPLTLLLPAYLAVYPAGVFWLLNRFRLGEHIRLILVLPLLWALGEWLREHAFTGFGWGAIGYSQIPLSPLAGYAPVGGIFLVTWATMFSGACLARFWFAKTYLLRIQAVLILVVVWLAGGLLLHQQFTTPDGTKATVALAQGDIDQSIKWDESSFHLTLTRYLAQIANSPANIVILPETAIPLMRQDVPDFILAQFTQQAQKNGSALAVGMPQYEYTAGKVAYQNAVINLSQPETNTSAPAFYAKNHLVPFGEYVPLPQLIGWIYDSINIPLTGFSKGGANQSPLLLFNQHVAFNICYEDGFGDELIASARQSSLLANVSNMAWYGHSHAMYQQLQQSQTRALEMGRYMVRATNNGVTAIINPKGRVEAQLLPDVAGVLQGTVKGYTGNTPYMWLGGSWPLVILSLVLLLLIWFYGYRRSGYGY